MGGFIAAKFVTRQEVYDIIASGGMATVELYHGKSWKPIVIRHRGIDITIEQQRTDAGSVHSISGSIEIRKEDPNITLLQKSELLLLAATKSSGSTILLGTQEHPLQVTCSELTPSEATGFDGYVLNISGQQLEPPTKLV